MKLTKEKLLHLIREELAENVTNDPRSFAAGEDVSVMVDSILDSGDLDRALESAKRSFYEMADQGAFGEFLDAYEVLKEIK
jgi:hypothetical protein